VPTEHIKFQKLHTKQTVLYRAMSAQNTGDRQVWRCGRRFGKTTLLEIAVCQAAINGSAVGWFSPNYKLLTPSYKRILKILRPIVANASRVDGIIELRTGGSIEFWTLNDEDAGRSRAYDLAVIDEAGLMKKGLQAIWEQSISPTLLDRRGNAIMAGTPKGIDSENFFYQACTDKSLGWTEHHLPTSENPTLDPVGVAKLQEQYPPLVYQQEFLALFVDWSGAAFFSLASLLVDGQGVPYPQHCDAVFITIDTAVKTGKDNDSTGCCYWAINKLFGIPLTLLDWDIVQIEGGLLEVWLPTVIERGKELAAQCGARSGFIGAWIEDKSSGSILLQQAARKGLQAHTIDSGLTAVGKDERAISVSGYVFQGKVKLSEYAYNKTKEHKKQTENHFIKQFCGYRIGVKDQADDLLDCGCYGIAIALGNAEGY
jgi:phage terminase large subunit-like protein